MCGGWLAVWFGAPKEEALWRFEDLWNEELVVSARKVDGRRCERRRALNHDVSSGKGSE